MSIGKVAEVLLRLSIEPEPTVFACCECGTLCRSRVLVYYLRRIGPGLLLRRGALCAACFEQADRLDSELPGADFARFEDYQVLRELLEGDAN